MTSRNNAHANAIGVTGAVLVGSSLLGGVASVLAGANTWANAWTAEATLAAPWPMLLVQTAATCASIQRRPWVATAGSAVLGLAAAVAGISGFFDGQLGRADLSGWFVVAQASYVAVAWGTAIVAGLRIWRLWPADRGAASSEIDAGGVVHR